MPSGSRKFGKAVLELSLNDRVTKGLKAVSDRIGRIGSQINDIGKRVTAVGSTVLAPLIGSAATFAKVGDNLDKMSQRSGVSAQSLGELGFAAEQTGSNLDAVEKGVRGMSRMILDAERGLSTAKDNLSDLGLTLDDLKGKSPEEQFQIIASRIAEIKDPTKQAALAMKVFGRSGADLRPLLSLGGEGIAALRQEARDLGIVMSQDDVEAAAELTDAINRIRRQFIQFVTSVGAAVAGPMLALLEQTKSIAKAAIDWVNANRPLIVTLLAVGAGIATAGAVLLGIGSIIQVISFAVGGLATLVATLGAVFGALISPIGLAVAGITAAATWFLTATETGQMLVDTLMDKFGSLFGVAKDAFNGIADLLAAGEIEAAGAFLWTALKLLWLEGTAGLREKWIEFTGFFVQAWHGAVVGLAKVMVTGWNTIKNLWDTGFTGLLDGFDVFSTMLSKAWLTTVAFFEKVWLRIKSLFGADVAAEIDKINEDLAATNKILDEDQGRRSKKRQDGLGQRIAGRDADAAAITGDLDAELKRRTQRTDDGTQQRLADAQKAVDEARKAWEQAKTAADDAVTAAEQNAEERQKGLGVNLPEGLALAAATVDGGAKAQATLDASFAGQQFGGNTKEVELLSRIAEATEENNRRKNEGLPSE